MSNMRRTLPREAHNNNWLADTGDTPRSQSESEITDTPRVTRDIYYIHQSGLDSPIELAVDQPEAVSIISTAPAAWPTTDCGSSTAYPSPSADIARQVWPSSLVTTSQIANEITDPWFTNFDFEVPDTESNNLQWPLTSSADNVDPCAPIMANASDQHVIDTRRGLPRRRSRHRSLQSMPIPVAHYTSTDSLNPMQRWRESPPQDEPASIAAICNALRANPLRPEDDESRNELAYIHTNSATSMDSGGSSSSMQSTRSVWSTASDAPRGRQAGFGQLNRTRKGRIAKKGSTTVLKDTRPFKCTFCCDSFKTKYDWARHEKSRHLNLESWICAPRGGSVMSTVTGHCHCVYCSAMDPSHKHLEEHSHSNCHERPIEARLFGRKDHLVQHLRVMHKLDKLPRIDDWKVEATEISSRCGFCDLALSTWSERVDHLAKHFRKGVTMREWRGEHGFVPAVAQKVVHALPPYLIGSESLSVVPFSATSQSTKDHFAQISSRTHTLQDAKNVSDTEGKELSPLQTASILSSRIATSKAFTEILEQHLKHFAEEYMSQGVYPSDEVLRQESRRVIYDCDDEWNQTVADNSEWLTKFRRRHGLDGNDEQHDT